MSRIFISGPISNKPNLNRDAFYAEAEKLFAEGHQTFNPHDIAAPSDEEQNVMTEEQIWQYYMRVCVGQIPLCDGMRMLPDWQNSRGSVWEHRIATFLGLEITYCHVPDPNPKW